MNRSELKETLIKYELGDSDIANFMKILTICDTSLYSPSAGEEKMKMVYKDSESLIVALEEKI